MIINIQSFQKDVKDDQEIDAMTPEQIKKLNVINRESDRLSGRKPIDFIRATNPVVIIDEPQSVEGDTTREETVSSKSIGRLNPLCTLRYSATHKNYHNLLYKLDPIQAYDLRLVKRIEVDSVIAEANVNEAFVKLEKVDNKNGIKAKLVFNVKNGSDVSQKSITVKKGDDLFVKSKDRLEYRDGFIVSNIDCTPGMEHVEFNNGQILPLGKSLGGNDDEVMKKQVRETVEQHLMKERAVKGKGIKVLSLFFIDRVSNYRAYNDDKTVGLGKIGKWFEESYSELLSKDYYKGLLDDYPVEKLHNGYFSQDKKGKPKDTSGQTKDDDDTYALIMRDKERLLSLGEPLRFIFSHSALREGWDNPNVFQICTLNESRSVDRKRQEIGRGLRLPVNQNGERVHDETINRLTVIANEAYHDFASKLQTEYEEDYGITFGMVSREAFSKLLLESDGKQKPMGQEASLVLWEHLQQRGYLNQDGKLTDFFDPKNPHFCLDVPHQFEELSFLIVDKLNSFIFKNRIVNARERKQVKATKNVLLDEGFKDLWKRISQRTRYRVNFKTEELVNVAAGRLRKASKIEPIRIETTKAELKFSQAGIEGSKLAERVADLDGPAILPDLLAYLQNETDLTRRTIVEIIRRSGRANEFKINPQMFITITSTVIQKALRDLMLEGIEYERIDGDYWEMRRLEQDDEEGIIRYLNNLYEVQNTGKTPYNYVEFDSKVERQFAADLDNNEDVKFFVKLPAWFRVDTPLGTYNPDWAILTEREKKLYMVRETKSTTDNDKRRESENKKIQCGKKHFDTIGVDFKVVTNLREALKG
jgi:type III restriction enzyme